MTSEAKGWGCEPRRKLARARGMLEQLHQELMEEDLAQRGRIGRATSDRLTEIESILKETADDTFCSEALLVEVPKFLKLLEAKGIEIGKRSFGELHALTRREVEDLLKEHRGGT